MTESQREIFSQTTGADDAQPARSQAAPARDRADVRVEHGGSALVQFGVLLEHMGSKPDETVQRAVDQSRAFREVALQVKWM